MDIVNSRYNGNHDEYNYHMTLNIIISVFLTILGLLNCYLIKKLPWWRSQVSIINTIIILSYLPLYNTYVVDEIFMLSIPMHIFHILTIINCTDSILQVVFSTLILFSYDMYYLLFYLIDSERLYENRYNIIVFFNIYMISSTIVVLLFLIRCYLKVT